MTTITVHCCVGDVYNIYRTTSPTRTSIVFVHNICSLLQNFEKYRHIPLTGPTYKSLYHTIDENKQNIPKKMRDTTYSIFHMLLVVRIEAQSSCTFSC